MDNNALFAGANVKRAVTPEQVEVKDAIPDVLDMDTIEELIAIKEDTLDQDVKNQVPIFKLKAEEDARKLTRRFKDDKDYEELVKYVKKWRERIKGEDDTIMDHKALAIILDNQIMFEELKRGHEVLDNSAAFFSKTTNLWSEHCEMYDKLLSDMIAARGICDEAQEVLDDLNSL